MRSCFKICIVIAALPIAFVTTANAEPPQSMKDTLPPAASGILTQMDKEIIASKKKAVEALDKVLKDTTKKGDLSAAIAVKQAIERLDNEIKVMVSQKEGQKNADIVGIWKGTQGWTLKFLPDGTVMASDGNSGRWIAIGTSVEVRFADGVTHSMERTAKGYAGIIRGSTGQKSADTTYTREP